MVNIKKILYFLIGANLFCSLCPINGQTDENKFLLYSRFDSLTGKQNSSLYNGTLFVDDFRAKGHKHRFYETSHIVNGSVTYDNQAYFGEKLKYDLYDDAILVNPKGTSEALLIRLRTSKVQSFTLNDHNFLNINSRSVKKFSTNLGFCEVLEEEGSSLLLKKIKKMLEKQRNADYEYAQFRVDNSYFIVLDTLCKKANTRREWLALFPDEKKDVKSFYVAYKTLRKTDTDAFHMLMFNRFMSSKRSDKANK